MGNLLKRNDKILKDIPMSSLYITPEFRPC